MTPTSPKTRSTQVKAIAIAAAIGVISATAAQAEKVVIYSPHGDEIMTSVADRFTAQTGIDVEYLSLGGGELVDRVRAESANPVADVLYGNPSSVFMELNSEGLLASFTPSWAGDLDPYFRAENDSWFGTIQTPVVLFYNDQMLSAEEAPTDWFELTDSRFADEIIIRSTTSAASRALHAALAYQFDKNGTLETQGWDFFGGLDANIKRYVPDSGLMFQAIGRQEGAVGFWTLSGVIQNRDTNNLPLTIVNAESGSPVLADAIAIVAGAKNRDAAEQFVEFAGGVANQIALANEFNRMPTLDAALADAPAWMSEFEYAIMDVDWGRLAEKQSEWIQYIEDQIRDTGKVQQN